MQRPGLASRVRLDNLAVYSTIAALLALLSFAFLRFRTGGITEGELMPKGLVLRGMPMEFAGAAWCLTILASMLGSGSDDPSRDRAGKYGYWTATIGFAGALWCIVAVVRHGNVAVLPWQYWVTSAALTVAFICSALAAKSIAGGAKHVWPDFQQASRRPITWCLVIPALALLTVGPHFGTNGPASAEVFGRWYVGQPRASLPLDQETAAVSLIEFVDYQCPVCRSFDRKLEAVLSSLSDEERLAVRIQKRDFPLEHECNASLPPDGRDLHSAACEAAAAVRIARRAGVESKMVDWLWANQTRLNRVAIAYELRASLGADFQSAYGDLLPEIAKEAALGTAMGVNATPAVWLNGVQLGAVTEDQLRWAILHELREARLTKDTK